MDIKCKTLHFRRPRSVQAGLILGLHLALKLARQCQVTVGWYQVMQSK
jgi:hypothetical protein